MLAALQKLPTRPLGSTGLELSTLCFGSMRLVPVRLSIAEGVQMLSLLLDRGVNCFHFSSEYESFPHFAAVVRELQHARPHAELHWIGKVGVPHFGENAFDPGRFEAKIDHYLKALDVECIDVAQWLLRFDLKEEAQRQAIFDRDADVFSATIDRLRRAGKIRAAVSFPYTRGIAERALALDACAGLALYVNPLERELADLLDRALALGKSVIAIRPLAAGRIVRLPEDLPDADRAAIARLTPDQPSATEPSERVRAAFRYALSHPAIVTTVVSLNGTHQADSAIDAIASSAVDHSLFQRVTFG